MNFPKDKLEFIRVFLLGVHGEQNMLSGDELNLTDEGVKKAKKFADTIVQAIQDYKDE